MLTPRRKLDGNGSYIITGNPQDAEVITELKIESFFGARNLLPPRLYHSISFLIFPTLSIPSTPECIPTNCMNEKSVPCCGIDDIPYIDEEQNDDYFTPTHLKEPQRCPDTFLKLYKEERALKVD